MKEPACVSTMIDEHFVDRRQEYLRVVGLSQRLRLDVRCSCSPWRHTTSGPVSSACGPTPVSLRGGQPPRRIPSPLSPANVTRFRNPS
ncbi:hypothetical protein V2G26_019456 [Clonostachys chloroleuca]